GNLGVSSEQGTWVITSFAVSNAIALPLTGWLARRVGEVRLFIAAALLFVLASFLCGIAQSMPSLVGFRALQGKGHAALSRWVDGDQQGLGDRIQRPGGSARCACSSPPRCCSYSPRSSAASPSRCLLWSASAPCRASSPG
ncbi:MFS transporter, partial [Pseudomonas aeruginosa]